jgi:hypothetical protein
VLTTRFTNLVDRYTNTSQQLRWHTSSNVTITAITRGWIDDRGKFN